MGLKELERVRLILRGGSVVDWRRLHFRNRDEVDRFLRLCCLDLTQAADEAWAREYWQHGYRMLAYGLDHLLFQAALRSGLETLRGLAR